MREYEQKQLRSRDTLARHYAEVYTRSPEFQSLDESISILSVQYGKRLLNGDDHAVESLKSELAILRKQKDELLQSCGFPSDYLEPSYECSSAGIRAISTIRSAAALRRLPAVSFMSSPT